MFIRLVNLYRIKQLLIIGISIFMSILIGFLLNFIAYTLPTERIEKHVLASASAFAEANPVIVSNSIGGRLDGFTDALMLLTASHPNELPFYQESLLNTRYVKDNLNPPQTLYYMGTIWSQGVFDESEFLSLDYARYWHGYLLALKILLQFVDYTGLRIVNAGIVLLLIFFLWREYKKADERRYMIPVVSVLLFLNPASIVLSLQFTGVSIIMLCALIILVRYKPFFIEHSTGLLLFFTLLGCVTSYIDLLTYPLITLGIPLAYWGHSMLIQKKISNRELATTFCVYGLAWIVGYLGMWLGKWSLATLLTDTNVFQAAYQAGIHRTSHVTESSNIQYDISFLSVLKHNIRYCRVSIIVLLLAMSVYSIYQKYKKKYMYQFDLSQKWSFVCIALLPLIWYFIFQNHSYIHAWFTFRTLSISVYIIVLLLVSSIRRYQ